MSPKLKRLSGDEVIAIFERFGFEVHSRRGSHVKLRREISEAEETLTIAVHSHRRRHTEGDNPSGEQIYTDVRASREILERVRARGRWV